MSSCWADKTTFWTALNRAVEQVPAEAVNVVDGGESGWFDEEKMVATPDGTVHLIYGTYYNIWYVKKAANSNEWTSPVEIVPLVGDNDIRNRSMFVAGNNIYIVYSKAGDYVCRFSADNGLTWSETPSISSDFYVRRVYGCDDGSGAPIVAVLSSTTGNSRNYRLTTYKHSGLGAGSWTLFSTITPENGGNQDASWPVAMTLLSNGEISLIVMEGNWLNSTGVCEYTSSNNGANWSKTLIHTAAKVLNWYPASVAYLDNGDAVILSNKRDLIGDPDRTVYIRKVNGAWLAPVDFPYLSPLAPTTSGIFPCGDSFIALYADGSYNLAVSRLAGGIFETPFSLGSYEWVSSFAMVKAGGVSYMAYEADFYRGSDYYANAVVRRFT